MGRVRRDLSEQEVKDLRDALLKVIPRGEENPRLYRDILMEIMAIARWREIPVLRIAEVISALRAEGIVVARKNAGYWQRTRGEMTLEAEIVEEEEEAQSALPVQASKKERDYYSSILKWFAAHYDCYGKDVSEVGKRGARRGNERLVAVPDLVGVRYHAGPWHDELDLIAVEVKIGRPTKDHISEVYRYSRFADLCILAYDSESLTDGAERQELLAECTRLGLGVLQFPSQRGRGRIYNVLLEPIRQVPDSLSKANYLSEKLDVWRCMRCSTFHVVEDRDELTTRQRSEEWTEILDPRDMEAVRFICRDCSK